MIKLESALELLKTMETLDEEIQKKLVKEMFGSVLRREND